MIPIRFYRSYWIAMGERIAAINQVLFSRTEEELQKLIKDVSDGDIILVAVVPSSDTVAPDRDNIRELESALIFVLMKVNRNNMNDEDLIDAQEQTQNIIKQIKTFINYDADTEESEFHHLCRDIRLSKMHTDPEWNYMNCDGYSLSFQFNTIGF